MNLDGMPKCRFLSDGLGPGIDRVCCNFGVFGPGWNEAPFHGYQLVVITGTSYYCGLLGGCNVVTRPDIQLLDDCEDFLQILERNFNYKATAHIVPSSLRKVATKYYSTSTPLNNQL